MANAMLIENERHSVYSSKMERLYMEICLVDWQQVNVIER